MKTQSKKAVRIDKLKNEIGKFYKKYMEDETPDFWDKDKIKTHSEYNQNSRLMLVYDGGSMYSIMSNEFGYELGNEFYELIQSLGWWYEHSTGWSCAFYKQSDI